MSIQIIKGNNAISVDNQGWVLMKRPHGTFFRTTTQAIVDPTVNTEVINFDSTADLEGLIWTVGNPSRVYVPISGSYEIVFSGVATLTSGNDKKIDIWLKVNGTTVASTNTIINLFKNAAQVMSASFIYDLTAGQYVELGTWGEVTQCQWTAYTGLTTPTRPDCPAMIVTVKCISNRLSYE